MNDLNFATNEWFEYVAESSAVNDVTFSIDGLGNVPDNSNVDYLGFIVYMTPREFLQLNPRRTEPSKYIRDAILSGKPIAPPFLSVKFTGDDENPNERDAWTVHGHEGRGRMLALINLGMADKIVPVHVFPMGGLRSRHISPPMALLPIMPDERAPSENAIWPAEVKLQGKKYTKYDNKNAVLNEDSRGSMRNILGIDADWANRFHAISTKHAFILAKIYFMSEYAPRSRDHLRDQIEIMNSAKALAREKDLVHFMRKVSVYGGNGGIGAGYVAMEILAAPRFAQKFTSQVKNLPIVGGSNDLGFMLRNFSMALGQDEEEQDRPIMLSFPDGMKWANLQGNACPWEGAMMQHCGDSGFLNPDMTLVSLRDRNSRPHVTMTYDKDEKTLMDIRGGANSIPKKKYWNHIKAFKEKFHIMAIDDELMPSWPDDLIRLLVGAYAWRSEKKTNRNEDYTEIKYRLDGEFHRMDGPAYIIKSNVDRSTTNIWYRFGYRHRTDGPAEITIDANGTVVAEKWLVNGALHREDGPAMVERDENGKVELEAYWLRGQAVDKSDIDLEG